MSGPSNGSLIVTTRFGNVAQLHRVRAALGMREQLTWSAEPITAVWSHIGNTEIVIGVCVLAVAALWWRTKQWWYAVIPAIAISLQASVFVAATAVTRRQRPLVDHLDPAPPTSSYPSGPGFWSPPESRCGPKHSRCPAENGRISPSAR